MNPLRPQIQARIQLKTDTVDNWKKSTIGIQAGEMAVSYEVDKKGQKVNYKLKIGQNDQNGKPLVWSKLPFVTVNNVDISAISKDQLIKVVSETFVRKSDYGTLWDQEYGTRKQEILKQIISSVNSSLKQNITNQITIQLQPQIQNFVQKQEMQTLKTEIKQQVNNQVVNLVQQKFEESAVPLENITQGTKVIILSGGQENTFK